MEARFRDAEQNILEGVISVLMMQGMGPTGGLFDEAVLSLFRGKSIRIPIQAMKSPDVRIYPYSAGLLLVI